MAEQGWFGGGLLGLLYKFDKLDGGGGAPAVVVGWRLKLEHPKEREVREGLLVERERDRKRVTRQPKAGLKARGRWVPLKKNQYKL